MDIKDFILIGGGLLILAVVVHGFWIAWRARRDPLRLDLVKNLPAGEDGDDLQRLRAELPNGGARVVGDDWPAPDGPRQTALELDENAAAGGPAPVLLDPSHGEPGGSGDRSRKTEPRLEPPPSRSEGATAGDGSAAQAAAEPEPAAAEESAAGRAAEAASDAGAAQRGKVRDVIMPERPIKADEPKEPRRWSARKDPAAAAAAAAEQRAAAQQTRSINRLADRGAAESSRRGGEARAAEPRADGERPAARGRRGGVQGPSGGAEPAVEELIMVNVLAPKGSPFVGGGLVETLRARGLRYGDMNIFHRVDPMTKASLYSVANVVEPGTFDMADLDNFRSPGVCFFMQLPGPEQPMDVFEDMLKVARDVAVRMGGELKDEQRSVMTGQTVEHYRQRISDYCRRRMSMRA